VSPFDIYEKYVALKAHFNSEKYDYMKFGGKIGCRRSSFENRKDKKVFEQLSRKNWDYIIPYMIANFVANQNLYIGDLIFNQESETTYFDWKRKRARLYTETKEELSSIKSFMEKQDVSFNELFLIKDDQLPIIFRLMIQRFISMETYIILDIVLGFSESFSVLLEDVVYKQWELKLRKYKVFMSVDAIRCQKIVKAVFL